MPLRPARRQWDIFCKVIDNFGDIGVCWRLAADLAARGHSIRLWVDDASALAWMAPGGSPGVELLPWTQPLTSSSLARLQDAPCDVMVEAFGCEIAPEFIAACADITRAGGTKPLWINLEYLSAEDYVARCHGLPSPVNSGPAAGWTKWFFYPGFTAQTGGLLREPDLAARQAAFDPVSWLRSQGISQRQNEEKLVSLFCYEPPALAALMRRWSSEGLAGRPVRLLVTAGRAAAAVKTALGAMASTNKDQKGFQPNEYPDSLLSISYLTLLTQADFDHLLWACDLNFVRGEDSLVRAIWAGKPFVWQIYPQDDGAHQAKLDAFLDMVNAPLSLRAFHHGWNGLTSGGDTLAKSVCDLPAWAEAAQASRGGLSVQADMTASLLEFAVKKR